MRRFVPVFLACWAFLSPSVDANEGTIEWTTSPSGAFDRAAEARIPVVVDFWAVWCVPCQVMDRTTYLDPRVVEGLRGVVPLKVDADANEVLVARYAVDAFPTLLVLDAEGREIARRRGLVEADTLVEMLDTVMTGYRDYLEAVGSQDDPGALERVAAYLAAAGNPLGAIDALRRSLRELGGAPSERVQSIEISIAEQLLDAGRLRQAMKSFERLAESSADPTVRRRAYAGLARAERERGREERARIWLDRLREVDPDRPESSSL